MDADLKVARSIIDLMHNHAFFATFAMKMNVEENNSISTWATDGKKIYWSRKFTDALNAPQATAVLCHEIFHCVLHHFLRKCRAGKTMDQMESTKWNIAEDFVINQTLIDMGLQFPTKLTVDGEEMEFCINDKYRDWTAEQVYADLDADQDPESIFRKMESNAEFQEKMQKMYNDVMGNDLSDAERKDLEDKMNEMTMGGYDAAKKAGQRVSNTIEEIIKSIRKPQVNWKSHLRTTMISRNPTESSMSRPNRKILGGYGIYLPSNITHHPGPIAVVLDTSGSVSIPEREMFLAELQAINQELKPECIHILNVDAKVATCQTITHYDDLTELSMTGGGGTDMQPGFTYIEECLPEVEMILCFSDLEFGKYWPQEPVQPLIWISTTDKVAPYGTTLRIV